MQNLVALDLPTEDLPTFDRALASIETILAHGVALTPQGRDLYKMGRTSASFRDASR